jgi:ribosomal-protein-serine acetyltransferase
MFAHIVGDGVELRLLETRHAEEVFRAVEENREHLARWLPWVDHTKSPEDVKDFIQHELLRFAKNSGFAAGIFHHGKYVGNIGVHDIDWNAKMTSIGYWLDARYQGRGIMTACCRAVLNHCFGTLGLNRVEIRARPDNARSRAVAIRLGFREEGVLRQVDVMRDRYYDQVVYSLLRKERVSL